MKMRSYQYDLNRSRYMVGISNIMMVIGIKQHLSNIWSSAHEKVKQHWGWAEKKRWYTLFYISNTFFTFSNDFLITAELDLCKI